MMVRYAHGLARSARFGSTTREILVRNAEQRRLECSRIGDLYLWVTVMVVNLSCLRAPPLVTAPIVVLPWWETI